MTIGAAIILEERPRVLAPDALKPKENEGEKQDAESRLFKD